MDQAQIDRIQQEWVESWVDGACLHVGCGQKRIDAAINVDPNPSRFAWVDVVADVHHLPFPAGVFDSVVSSHVMQALKRLPVAIGEMARVLAPSGVMAHVIPDHRVAPFKMNKRYPYQYMWNRFLGARHFQDTYWDLLADHFAVAAIEDFEEFTWSFTVAAMREDADARASQLA